MPVNSDRPPRLGKPLTIEVLIHTAMIISPHVGDVTTLWLAALARFSDQFDLSRTLLSPTCGF